jgi:anti-anti-sigma factor
MSSIISTFSIHPVSQDENRYCYSFVGSIDAHANPVLETLHSIPSKAHVLLDFSQVERVNSMGLSLLLKLFEEWEQKKIKVEVQQLDRMVNMLFKITGLGRFVKTDGTNSTADSFAVPANPEPPRNAEHKAQAPSAVHDKLNFVASLQSGQQLTGWYLLNTYLQRKMKKAIHFEQSAEHVDGNNTDLLFAKPFEACSMIKQYGFVPAMRPVAETDEVVLLTRADDQRNLPDYHGVCVGTATQDSFVYLLGRFLCDESGLDSSKFSYDFAGNEIKSLQSLIRKKCDLVFMLKKSYEGLSSFSRSNVRKLDESETHFACHLFCTSPHLKDESALLAEVLLDMENDEQGKKILEDIQIEGWIKPESAEVQMLQMVYDRYVK